MEYIISSTNITYLKTYRNILSYIYSIIIYVSYLSTFNTIVIIVAVWLYISNEMSQMKCKMNYNNLTVFYTNKNQITLILNGRNYNVII